jgi:hypothetical protein
LDLETLVFSHVFPILSFGSNIQRGCVTPVQIGNLKEECGDDADMVDGYDEIPPEMQEKVQFAIVNGHVSDEDWKGDVECNRPGAKGFRVKGSTPKKAGAKKNDKVSGWKSYSYALSNRLG